MKRTMLRTRVERLGEVIAKRGINGSPSPITIVSVRDEFPERPWLVCREDGSIEEDPPVTFEQLEASQERAFLVVNFDVREVVSPP
jgi:hypothetical protein